MTADLQFHPLAKIFPLIDGEEFAELTEDIRTHGLHEPVVMFEGQILDGRNRYRACVAAGTDCRFESYEGEDPAAYVVSLNLKRRHLSESQRAMVAANLANMKSGARTDLAQICARSQDDVATLLNVSRRSVQSAAAVRERGAPELIRAVEADKVSVSAAANIATLPVETQREIIARCDKREVLKFAKHIRAQQVAENRAEWNARIIEMSKANAPLPCDRRYPIILADPAWPYEAYNAASGMQRAAESHYPCMSIEEICSLPVADIATPDAALFLWTTSPHLQAAFSVLEAWGFEYRTNIVWVKDNIGLGYWVRNQHELLLIAARGKMRSPSEAVRPPSVIMSPRREHSRKPDGAYALIEAMYPELPKIELFARGRREHWSAWGNQAPGAVAELAAS
jgi:N6-adenosine-specific RNA methylase IME4/ParB-like chromosome segregation protein Spo0J